MLRVTALFCILLFCSVIDVIQSQTAVGTISLNPAEFGSVVTLNCTGAPAPGDTGSIAWLKRLPLTVLVTTTQVISSEFSLIHVLYNVTARDSGDYICRFDSHLTTVNHTDDVINLEIIPAVDIIENPATHGSNVTLYCVGGPAPGDTGSLLLLSPSPNVIASSGIVTDNTMVIHVLINIDASVGGEYTCRFDSITRPNADNTMTLQIFPYFTDATTGTKVLQTNGSTFNVTCEAEGFPTPSMELVDLRSSLQTVATTSSNSLTHMFVSFQFGQEGSYHCVATSAIRTIYHNFTIILSPDSTATPNFIIAAPDSSADFSCSALGGPGNQFVWIHNGTRALCSDCPQELTSQDIQGLIKGTSNVVVSEGTSLNIPSVNISVVGVYGCLVANDAGFDVEFVSLYMTPLIIEHPQSGIVKDDESFYLTCKAQSFPSPTYQWEKFNEMTSQFEDVSPNGNASTLELNPVGSEGYGRYRCVASTFVEGIRNSTISNEARVAAPPRINPPNDTAKSGDIVMFNCSTNGGPRTFKWFKGDTEITTGSPFTIINETEDLSSLIIDIVTGEEYGNYTCIVTNFAGTAQATAKLAVSPEDFVTISMAPNVTLNRGDDNTLTCNTTAGPDNIFTWIRQGDEVIRQHTTVDELLNDTSLIVSQDKTLVLTNVNPSHGDSYTCLVINNAGFGVASIIVYIRPYFIIEPAENVFAQVSTSVNLTCVAESFPEPSKYEWFKLMSGSFVKLEGENTTTLIFPSVDFSDFGTYRCEATTDILNVTITSRESVLHVSPFPSVDIQPQNATTEKGESPMFNCSANGGPNNQFRWFKDDTEISSSDSKYDIRDEGNHLSILTINNIVGGEQGVYKCVVNNSAGDHMATTRLDVSSKDLVTVTPANNITLDRGDNHILMCQTPAGFNNQIIWLKRGQEEACCPGGQTTNLTNLLSDTSLIVGREQALELRNINASHGGSYTCLVINDAGFGVNCTIVYIRPYFIEQPDENIFSKNLDPVTVTCRAESFPEPTFQWEKMNSSGYFQEIPGETNSTLVFSSVGYNDFGNYRCVIRTAVLDITLISNTSTLHVSPENSVRVEPSLQIIDHGSEINFTCIAQGGPDNIYLWFLNASNHACTDCSTSPQDVNQFLISLSNSSSLNMTFVSRGQVLTISDVNATLHGGTYFCVVLNDAGYAVATGVLFVTVTFTQQPTDIKTTVNMNIEFTCEAQSFPHPSYSWERFIDSGFVKDERGNMATLSFMPVSYNDAGVYRCVATSSNGSEVISILSSDNATLYVSLKGSVQLINQTLTKQGGTFSLECKAEGGPNNQHIWYHRGVLLADTSVLTIASSSNDTHSLSILSVSNVDAATHKGDYTCNVTNMAGSESKTSTVVVSPEGIVFTLPINETHSRDDIVNFTCTTDAGPGNVYVWLRNSSEIVCSDCDGGFFNGTINTDLVMRLAIAISENLTLTDITAPTDGGTYDCVVLNNAGFGIDSSILYVVPYFVVHPQNVELEQMQTLRLTCEAEAFPSPSIQWEKMNRVTGMFEAIFDENSTVFMINSVSFSDFGMYRCVATNVIGGIEYNTNSSATLVTISPKGSVIVQPKNMTFDYEDEVNLTCTCQGGPNNMFSWLLNGSTITSGASSYIISSTDFSSILTISRITAPDHGGLYQCIAQNIAGNGSVTTYVFVSPRFIIQPFQTLSVNGMNNNLTCEAESFPVPQHMWRKHEQDGRILDVGPDDYFLPFNPIVFGDAGIYQCIATSNSITIYSNNATLYVSPEGSVQLISQTLTEQGRTFSLECRAKGGPNNQHAWYHRGVVLVDTSVLNITSSSNDTHSVSILSVSNVDAGTHKGDYTCNVTNMAGSESKTSIVVVSPEGIVSTSPMNSTHIRGDNVNFTCTTDAGPYNIYVWLRHPIQRSFNERIDRDYFIELAIAQTQNLALSDITASTNGGIYYCVVLNDAGYGIDSSILFVVPEFVVHPQNMELEQMQTLTFTCEVEAFPFPSIQWEKMNKVTGMFEAILSETSTTFSIRSVIFSDFGMYRCVASNVINGVEYNATSSAALVTISPKGSVMIQPQNATFNYEDEVNLTCTCQGGPNNTFIWLLNGSSIISDTNSYSIISTEFLSILVINRITAPDHGGLYRCIAQNIAGDGGDTTYVYISPRFLIHPVQTLAVNGTIQNLTCEAESFPVPQYMWYKHVQNGETSDVGPNDHLLPFKPIIFSNAGVYQCTATSNSITIYSNNATLYVSPEGSVQLINETLTKQGSTFSLECRAEGGPNNQHLWYHRGVRLADTSVLTITSSSNDTHSVSILNVSNVDVGTHKGDYTCNVTNMAGSESKTSTVVFPPSVLPVVSNYVIGVLNKSITIAFTITNDFPPVTLSNILWFFKSLDSNTFKPISSQVLSSDRLSLTIANMQLSDRGMYKMSAENEAGVGEATITLDVLTFVKAALLNDTGGSVTKARGQSVKFNCTADGIPRPDIVWRRNGQLFVNTSRAKIMSSEESDGFRSNIFPGVLQHTSILEITGLDCNDNGNYSCRANNEAFVGVVLVTKFTLQVMECPPSNFCSTDSCGGRGKCNSLSNGYVCECFDGYSGINCEYVVLATVPPQITQSPQDTSGTIYSTVNLTCKTTGSPLPTILWYKDNVLIPNDNTDVSVLLFPELDLNDRGFYHCEARSLINGNSIFVMSSNVLLNISDIVQYEAETQLPEDICMTSNKSISEKVSDLINENNNYISGSSLINFTNTSFFFVKILNADSINCSTQPITVPIIVTLLTSTGATDQLRNEVGQQIAAHHEERGVDISILNVIRFDGCPSTETVIPSNSGREDLTIIIMWPETNIGGEAIIKCPCGEGGGIIQATRYCGGDFSNGAKWSNGNTAACNFSDLAREICQLRNLPVEEKLLRLENLTSICELLGSTEIIASVSVLMTAIEDVSQNLTLTTLFLNIVDNILCVEQDILQNSQNLSNISSIILAAIESVSENIPITNTSEPVVIVQTTFAVSIQRVCIEEFGQSDLTFSVNYEYLSNELDENDVIFGMPEQQSTAAISLPNNLISSILNMTNCSKITNAVFISDSLFLRRSENLQEVGSLIIAASVVGTDTLRELHSLVNLTFVVNPNVNGSFPRCSFWNQSLDNGYGMWSSEGCRNTTVNDTEVICECNHLTNFAILLDVSPIIEPTEKTGLTLFLDSISYIGIIVSLVCLTVTIISYLSNKNLRTSDHGQLLLNLCFALMGLYITFIISVHSKGVPGVCAVVGAVLQYFFLVTFMVMAAEAIHLYMNLVIVLGMKIQYFVLKATILSWVTPLFIVLFCFAPNYKNYLSDHFCRAFTVPYYIGMVVPFLIIYLFNWVVFFIIIVSLIKKQCLMKTRKELCTFLHQQLVRAIALSVLFGLGWGIGLFATQDIHTNKTVQDILAALFVVFTAFHGLLIFIMQCLRSKEVRHSWKRCFFGVTGKDISELTSSAVLNKHQRERRRSSDTDIGPAMFVVEYSSKNSNVFVNPKFFIRPTPLESISETEEEMNEEGVRFAETPITKAFLDEIEKEERQPRKKASVKYTNYTEDIDFVETASLDFED